MGSPLGVILQFGADSTGAQQDVEKLQQKIAGMSSESAASIEKFSKRGIAAYEELQREYIKLGSQTANLRAALSENESQQTRLNQAISAGGADAVQATADLQRLEAEHGKLAQALQSSRTEFRAVSQASSAMMRENTLARENARSLAATFGVQLPESIGHFITQSKLAQETLASLFNVTLVLAFASAAVEGIEKIVEAYHEWHDASGEQKKELDEIIKDQDRLLTHAPTLAVSQSEIAETNRRLGELATKIAEVRKEQESLGHETGLVNALSPIQIGKDIGFSIRDHKLLNELLDEQSKLQSRLHDQLENQKDLEGEEHKSATEAAKKAAEAAAKQAEIYERARQAIAGAKAELPPFIVEIDRLSASIDHQNSGLQNSLDILKSYQQIAKEMSATPLQMGFAVPEATGVINTQIQAVGQLTAAQRALLPSERELQLANQELEREYPQLTAAERAEWAQILLTSDAYRKHIDESSKVKASNAQLGSSFNALAQQARTAFSQMAGEITGWGGVATRVFDQVFNTIAKQIEIEQRQAAEHQISQFSMTKATIDGLKQLAPVKAIIDTARGIEALAGFDFAAAAQWFAAAALWGTVGAFQIASMAGAFSPGSGGGSVAGVAASAASGGSASATADHSLASGAASAQSASGNQQHTIQVVFNGDVYGSGGMKEVIRQINGEVKFNRVQLFASHAISGRAIK